VSRRLQVPERLEDGVVLLRGIDERDRESVLATMGDPHVARWLNMPQAPGASDFDALLRTIADGHASGDRFDFGVCVGESGPAVGAVIASRRHRDNWELAYLAGADGRGRGLMTRAVRLVCDWLLHEGVGRIELRTMVENEPSQRLAERCGFVREGVERKSIWLRNRRHDAIVYSLLPEDPR
jgi:RimJ/RimL family protein N-acetyltransferase